MRPERTILRLIVAAVLIAPLALTLIVATPGGTPSAAADAATSAVIREVPHVAQKPDFCGEACLEMYLRKLGRDIDQDQVFNQAELDPALGRGCYTRELARAARKIGFDVGPVWHHFAPTDAPRSLDQQFAALLSDLKNQVPSVVCMHYDDQPNTTEHFRLVLGFDAAKDEVIYHEPAERDGAYRRMKRELFLKLWPLKVEAARWTAIRIRLQPKRLVVPGAEAGPSDADYAQHIRKLKARLPNEDFQFVIQKPFVVVGDQPRHQVQRQAEGTIKWAVDRIKKDYFAKDPDHIIDIWLFKDKASYEQNTWTVFRDRPSTPFGYYSPRHKALIMNISTGGGTLVHEIVHPFMAANFPACPAWFNEGLASLYEQCGDNKGRIWGYTNWRLRGLQAAVHDDRVPSFKTLCSTTTREFYDDDPGTNYAQARYLCHYLQKEGLLVKYFHQFRANARDDPTGYQTLVDVLGKPDMSKFQQRWQDYVEALRFPS